MAATPSSSLKRQWEAMTQPPQGTRRRALAARLPTTTAQHRASRRLTRREPRDHQAPRQTSPTPWLRRHQRARSARKETAAGKPAGLQRPRTCDPAPEAHAHRGRLLLTHEGACASRDRQARDLRANAHIRCRRPHTMNGQAASAMPDQHGGRAHRPATLRHAARASHDTPHPPREVGGPTPLRRRRRPRSEPPTRAGSHGARAQAE